MCVGGVGTCVCVCVDCVSLWCPRMYMGVGVWVVGMSLCVGGWMCVFWCVCVGVYV